MFSGRFSFRFSLIVPASRCLRWGRDVGRCAFSASTCMVRGSVCPCWPLCFFPYSGPKNRRDPLRSLAFRYICLLLTGSRAISILYWKCAGFVFPHPVPRVLFLWELKCFPEVEALGLGACTRRKRNSRGHVQ